MLKSIVETPIHSIPIIGMTVATVIVLYLSATSETTALDISDSDDFLLYAFAINTSIGLIFSKVLRSGQSFIEDKPDSKDLFGVVCGYIYLGLEFSVITTFAGLLIGMFVYFAGMLIGLPAPFG
jgi:hypothetical protein